MADSKADTEFKQTQAEILTREVDTNEYIPAIRQLKTDTKSIIGAINYLHGQYQTAILNANTAQRVAYDSKAVVDTFMANPPKDGKSAFEIANELRPAGFKFKDEREWIDSFDSLKAETLKATLKSMRIYTNLKSLTVTISPEEWHHRSDKDGGYTYTVNDISIKSNQAVELATCDTSDRALFKLIARATCDSINDGEMTIRIPEGNRPDSNIRVGFILKEYVLKGENE